jgi:hypothetical protein
LLARNLSGLPLVAYSGEIDGQKQAADIMVRYAEKEGITFPHVIGPQTPHKYHPDSKVEIEKFITEALVKGRDVSPKSVKFTTYTLIYPSRAWVTISGMEKEWERADVDATAQDNGEVTLTTSNISSLQLDFTNLAQAVKGLKLVRVDGTALPLPEGLGTGQVPLVKSGKNWRIDVAGARPPRRANDRAAVVPSTTPSCRPSFT